MLQVSDLTIRIGAHAAVRGGALSLARGQRLGLVGESGCGKSITALALMGMAPEGATVSGEIALDGVRMAGATERAWRGRRARDIAMIFQEPMTALNPLMRVGEILAEPLRLHLGLTRRAAWDRAGALLEEVSLPDPDARLRQYPHELSGGQRQRVLIALALACDPAVLIADEPTTALDARVAAGIIDLLLRLSQEREMALLFISHDLGAMARATDELIVMYGGDMVERGPTKTVLSDPRHPYTRGLLAARPQIGAPVGRLPSIPGVVPALADFPAGCRFAGRCPAERPECRHRRPAPRAVAPASVAACHALDGERRT